MFADDTTAGVHTEFISEGKLGAGYQYVMTYMYYDDKDGNNIKTSM